MVPRPSEAVPARVSAVRVSPGLCAHCHLPLPARPIEREVAGVRLSFCCAGCRTVFLIVGEQGGESGWFLAKLGLGAILSGNVMMFQFLLYLDSYRELGLDVVRTTSWIMLGLSIATYLLLGLPMLISACSELLQRHMGLELLIALGSLIAILASMRETILGGYHTYYDSATMILVLVTLGSYLDATVRERATRAIRAAASQTRRWARVRRGSAESEVSPDQVSAGEAVAVRAGEEIPTDGVVREGCSDVEEAAFSGEPLPRRVAAGDRVFAGSVALDGAIVVESSGVSETLADRVRRFAEQARSQRAPVAILADRASAVFIPMVLLIALSSVLVRGVLFHDWMKGGLCALAVLVVACPCALGLATPLATTVALSGLASRGTLVRSGHTLEVLAKVRRAIFDKTGTLTLGRPHLEASDLDAGDFAAAAAVERGVSHPFATAIVAEADRRAVPHRTARDVVAVPGGGAEGVVDGVRYLVGSADWLRSRGIAVPTRAEAPASSVWVAAGETVAGELRFMDPLRPEAVSALDDMRRNGIRTDLLSGDREGAVRRAGREAGFFESSSGLSPPAKALRIQDMRRAGGAIAMVGDGLNDAPALGAADVGIAFGRAADLSREKADVSILREDLGEVATLFRVARRTLTTVRGNLLWAFGYNLVGVGLAVAGRLSPIAAAVAMVLSSLFVVGNSMRLRGAVPHTPLGIKSNPGMF